MNTLSRLLRPWAVLGAIGLSLCALAAWGDDGPRGMKSHGRPLGFAGKGVAGPGEPRPPGSLEKPGEGDADRSGKDKSDKDKPDPSQADKGKPAEEPKSVPRPTKPPQPANPDELKVRPDSSGKVRFNFTGQAWLDVLQWLADISSMSLDWQELPRDYLNLITQRSYTVEEARGVINRHLLWSAATRCCIRARC